MTTPTVEEAINALGEALGRAAASNLKAQCIAHGWIQVAPQATASVVEAPPASNGHGKRVYRMSKAGRARQIKAMRRYWAAKRKAGKGKK